MKRLLKPLSIALLAVLMIGSGFFIRSYSEDWSLIYGNFGVKNGPITATINSPRLRAFEQLAYGLNYGGFILLVIAPLISALSRPEN